MHLHFPLELFMICHLVFVFGLEFKIKWITETKGIFFSWCACPYRGLTWQRQTAPSPATVENDIQQTNILYCITRNEKASNSRTLSGFVKRCLCSVTKGRLIAFKFNSKETAQQSVPPPTAAQYVRMKKYLRNDYITRERIFLYLPWVWIQRKSVTWPQSTYGVNED